VAYSPLLNPEKALHRRNLVLTEMEQDRSSATSSRAGPRGSAGTARCPAGDVGGAVVSGGVRQELEKRFGAEQVHEPA